MGEGGVGVGSAVAEWTVDGVESGAVSRRPADAVTAERRVEWPARRTEGEEAAEREVGDEGGRISASSPLPAPPPLPAALALSEERRAEDVDERGKQRRPSVDHQRRSAAAEGEEEQPQSHAMGREGAAA